MFTVRFDEALRFACRLHSSQLRKGTKTAYVSHLLAVCSLVMEHGGNEDESIAALLHDAIEDQGDSYPGGRNGLRLHIRELFGAPVLDIVEGCTDDEGFVKTEGPSGWRERKLAYLDHLSGASPSVHLVSCADKLHNARCVLADYRRLGDQIWARFRTGSAADQLWVYSELCKRFEGNPQELGAELSRTVGELRRLCGEPAVGKVS